MRPSSRPCGQTSSARGPSPPVQRRLGALTALNLLQRLWGEARVSGSPAHAQREAAPSRRNRISQACLWTGRSERPRASAMLGSGASGSGGGSGLPWGCWSPSLAMNYVSYGNDDPHHLKEQARQLPGERLELGSQHIRVEARLSPKPQRQLPVNLGQLPRRIVFDI